VPPTYDSLVAKLVVHAKTREDAIKRAQRALSECVIEGIHTNIPLHEYILAQPDFISGNFNIHWLEKNLAKRNEDTKKAAV
jgi:acetyl-CoA carboxylase biotin carboxylase subunit